MTSPTRFLRPLRSWKLWAVVVVLAAIGAGGYYGFGVWTDSSSEEQVAQTQLVPVTLGDLVNDVSVTGTLTYTTREMVAFSQQGIVSDVIVSEGDRVSAGDALAMLDAETVANLEKTIAQARVDVRTAEDALEDARNPYMAGADRQGRIRRGRRPPGTADRPEGSERSWRSYTRTTRAGPTSTS